ncbi:MAG: MOSC domain-containing protein [Thermaurantiacus tibetensis]|uniref:MOSC domain-containing protein n=1 Tax=Thermaurantiacus tibetensis TaxID=2759035 RepID=UPI0018908721|nr:MOSC domain-containing protein [Thermaurantiacus tibetensis]
MAHLVEVRTGRVETRNGHRTAYAKAPRDGPIAVTSFGLDGDEVGNRRVHGGPDKAVYVYAAANYPRWRADHPHHAARLVPGAFGENLLVDGLDEAEAHVGDRWRAGTALLEICQPRQPCSTLARWFGDPAMVEAMVRNGRSGWYCRVVEEGVLAAGDSLMLEHRPQGAWSIAAVLKASYAPAGADELRALAGAPGLAASWAAWAGRAARAPAPKPL